MLVLPAGTVTLVRTVKAELSLERFTARPPLGAAPVRVTVPVTVPPEVTLVGLTLRLLSDAVGGGGVGAEQGWLAVLSAKT